MIYPVYSTNVSEECLESILNNLRGDDKFEMMCEFGENYKEILKHYCLSSPYIQIIFDEEDKPLGLFGCKPTTENNAEVCLLVTDNFKKHFKEFLFHAKNYVQEWKTKYNRLENFVYKHNKQAIRWLKILGFEIIDYDEMKMYFFTEKENEERY